MKLEEKAKEEVKKMCNLADAIEKRGIEKGMQKGIQEGIEKGIQKGMQKGQLHVLMVLLQEKLGELTKETAENIITASQENLEELIHHFMTIQSEEDILRILKKI